MLSVIMLNVIMLSVIMLSFIMLSVIMLSVIMLSVIMLIVFALCQYVECHIKCLFLTFFSQIELEMNKWAFITKGPTFFNLELFKQFFKDLR